MSRYRPDNGLFRCTICCEVVGSDHRHRLWDRVLWVWDQGVPGRIVLVFYGTGALLMTTVVVVMARAVLGVLPAMAWSFDARYTPGPAARMHAHQLRQLLPLRQVVARAGARVAAHQCHR